MDKKLHDIELGTIILRQGSRYKRYTLKVSDGYILATMPERGIESRMLSFIEEKRDRLKLLLQKHTPRPSINESTDLQMATCRMQITREARNNVRTQLKDGLLSITFPSDVDLAEERIQKILREIIQNVSRHEAKRVLPGRLLHLAGQHGFLCTGVKINNSKTHWGSCTARKSINLSLSLMLLPWHLIDYVLLHELCHTIEMNHSERFWALMDKVTDNQAQSLRKELKQHHIR